MKTRPPLSVVLVGSIVAAVAVVSLAYHLTEHSTRPSFPSELVWISLTNLLAIVGGVYTILGRNWARWLVLLWIGFHVILSAFHSLSELFIHAALLAIFAYVLFRRAAMSYFRRPPAEPA